MKNKRPKGTLECLSFQGNQIKQVKAEENLRKSVIPKIYVMEWR